MLPAALAWGLVEALARRGVMACGLGARDTLWLEGGILLYGHELTKQVDPFQGGLAGHVDLNKDFIGKDALLRRRGHSDLPVRMGLIGDGRRAAREGDELCDSIGTVVGKVTSGTVFPTRGVAVSMGFVKLDMAEPGTGLSAMVRGRPEPVRVVSLPFYMRFAR
ncbi:MAG: hypothetical protein NTV55_16990 [Planctomycetota bacterium]|nr:hypothetical protein [Planctomycetota bacterium]